jgi:hypothetical protein
MQRSMRKQENIPLKLAEVQTLGAGGGPEAGENSELGSYGDAPERIWESPEPCEETLRNINRDFTFLTSLFDTRY